MTKKVRVENADASSHQVVVQVWYKSNQGTDSLVREYKLTHPAQLMEEYIHSDQYLVVKEL